MATTLTSKNVITRKIHTCYSCLRSFPIKTKMNYWSGIYEGSFNTVYACSTCKEIMDNSHEYEFPEGYVSDKLAGDETPEEYLKNNLL